MGRLAAALLLVLFAGPTLAAPASAALEVCRAACADEAPDADCPSSCLDCACCNQGARTLIACPGSCAPPSPPLCSVAADPAARLPAPDPEDVFHVPRLHRA